MVTCVNLSKPRMMLKDKMDMMGLDLKMNHSEGFKAFKELAAFKIISGAIALVLVDGDSMSAACASEEVFTHRDALLEALQAISYPVSFSAMTVWNGYLPTYLYLRSLMEDKK